MFKALAWSCLLLISIGVQAATESSIRLLDNRFRVDPSIEQITFVIYRADNSQPVVLVRPDGKNTIRGATQTMFVGTKSHQWTLSRLITLCRGLGRL